MTDTPRRFSESDIWQRQRTYFEEKGTEVWQQGIIPHYITTNPFLANAYSEVVLGFLRDVELKPNEPVYVIELGAGVGRLAHHFLKKFLPMLKLSPFPDLKICYVLTDLPDKTVDSWRTNPTLEAWMAAGRLDYAQLDLANPAPLKLRHSNQTLDLTKLANPPIYIANYVVDSLPQDLFWVESGTIEEYRVAVKWANIVQDEDWITNADLDFTKHPLSPNAYDLPELNQILQAYKDTLHQTVVSLPTQAIKAFDYFCQNKEQSRLIICADKGYERLEDLAHRTLPNLATHGSFSLSVNFDAIRRFVQLRQGHVLQPTQRHGYLHVTASVWNKTIQETRLAFYQAIEQSGPDEFFTLKSALQEYYDDLSIVQILAWLRWSGWDAKIFLRLFDRLIALLNQINEEEEDELKLALAKVGENYLNIGNEEDVDYCIGMLLFGLQAYDSALTYLQRSLDGYGNDVTLLYNMAVCHAELGDTERATYFLNETLTHDPKYKPAQDMLKSMNNGHK